MENIFNVHLSSTIHIENIFNVHLNSTIHIENIFNVKLIWKTYLMYT